jgi:hypothetical protein
MKYLLIFTLLLYASVAWGQTRAGGDAPPQVRIVRPADGSIFDAGQVKVDYAISGTAPKSVKVLIDGRAVQLLTDVRTGENTTTVDVPAHNCTISVVAQNDFGAGTPAKIELVHSAQVIKPSLYILAVGVGRYADPDLQLQYPAKDAADFVQAMQRQEGVLYEKVEVSLLTDDKATAADIRDELYRLQTETTARDVAMLYMAGHGVNNNVGDFFFMPVDADVERINASCVGYAEIKSAISGIAGKTVVFMDACHSGNVLGDNRRRAAVITQAVNDLAATDNGTVVFTSSTGRQYSLEDASWNNGAFTKALVEGIKGKADLFNNKSISIKTLDAYITQRVKSLTQGKQAPTTIIPQSMPDFPIADSLMIFDTEAA